MNSYLLYRPNRALYAFTAALALQLHISDPRGKIVQNIKFLPIDQNSDLILKLNTARQHESRGMLGFQNNARDPKLLKFHANRDNRAYLKKHDFQRKLVCQI